MTQRPPSASTIDPSAAQRVLEPLMAIGQHLERSAEPKEALEQALGVLEAQQGCRAAVLALRELEHDTLVIEQRGAVKTGACRGALARVVDEDRAQASALEEGAGWLYAAPIRARGAVIGALGVVEEGAREAALAEALLRFMTVAASMVGHAARACQLDREERRWLTEEAGAPVTEAGVPVTAPRARVRPRGLIGNSKAMEAVYGLIAQVSDSDATVLLRGESGVGKELVAQAIHYNSPRSQGPFVKVNCAALPETMLESELFGHERGAFTGAIARRKGRFELAHGGTLFLDEVGDFAPAAQVKLLRVLQEREFERVGGAHVLKADVRVIAATNQDLEADIQRGRFREDLYYRLNVFPIHIPPLRARRGDVTLLADFFVEKYSQAGAVRRISTPAIDMLVRYHWPGNVRELENCIERAVLLSQDGVIRSHHLPPSLQTAEASGTASRSTLQEVVEAVERETVLDALKSSKGNMAKAARDLGVTERIMGLRVRKYAIDPRRFRQG